jgi:hypothetical protein
MAEAAHQAIDGWRQRERFHTCPHFMNAGPASMSVCSSRSPQRDLSPLRNTNQLAAIEQYTKLDLPSGGRSDQQANTPSLSETRHDRVLGHRQLSQGGSTHSLTRARRHGCLKPEGSSTCELLASRSELITYRHTPAESHAPAKNAKGAVTTSGTNNTSSCTPRAARDALRQFAQVEMVRCRWTEMREFRWG